MQKTPDEADPENLESKEQLDRVSASSDYSMLTYKELPKPAYNLPSLLIHATVILSACLISKIDYLIEFAGAVPATNILFLFPALGYLVAKSKLS